MSIKVMSAIWEHAKQDGNRLLALLAIADNANDDGWAYPSQATIAKKVRVERRAIQKIIDRLESDGDVTVYHRISDHNSDQHLSNFYHLERYGNALAQPPADVRGKLRKRAPKRGVVSDGTGGGVPVDAGVVSDGTHESSVEPSLNKNTPSPKGDTASRKRNPYYDVILEVWRYTGAMNALMEKMLRGTATKAGWKEYNVTPGLEADEIATWAAWYRKAVLHDDTRLNMLEERAKIQSQVAYWRSLNKPIAAPATTQPVYHVAPATDSTPAVSADEAAALVQEARRQMARRQMAVSS